MTSMPDLSAAELTDLPEGPTDGNPTKDGPVRTRKERSDKGKPRGPRGSGTGGRPSGAAKSRALADDLLVPYAMMAAGLSMTAPTVAATLIKRGEKTVDALVKIAEKYPRMMKALQAGAKMGPAVELAETGVQVLIAAAVDFGRMPPEHPFAWNLGVTETYAETHPGWSPNIPPQPEPPNGAPFPFPTPPPDGQTAFAFPT